MKQSLIFIIHWNLSAYTNYFLEILLILNQSYEITLIDCAVDPINNRFKDDEHYYSKYINFCYYSSVDQLFSEITEKNLNSPIIISNSIRNNITPGFELAQKLNCPHILFEHFSSLVDPSAKISEELALRLKQLKRVIIPSEALRSFFTKTIPEALVLKYHLLPSSDYFLPITNHTRKRQLLYVGRVIEEKKIIDFIEINNTFLAKHKIELLVVGAGKLSDELSELE